jgi:MoxR-like ATPase
MRVPVGYPTAGEEREIVRRSGIGPEEAEKILDPEDVLGMQKTARQVYVDPAVTDYAVRLVLATRDSNEAGLPELEGYIEYGASPRASLGLVAAGKSMALLRGRGYALPQDVYDVAYDVLNHRLVLSYEALAENVTVDDVLVEMLSKMPAPRVTIRRDDTPSS